MDPDPEGHRALVFKAAVQAEIKLGRPVYRNEVLVELYTMMEKKLHASVVWLLI